MLTNFLFASSSYISLPFSEFSTVHYFNPHFEDILQLHCGYPLIIQNNYLGIIKNNRMLPIVKYSKTCISKIEGLSIVFFNDTATTEIYTLSLHDALPIY